jgi:hypothetical protein
MGPGEFMRGPGRFATASQAGWMALLQWPRCQEDKWRAVGAGDNEPQATYAKAACRWVYRAVGITAVAASGGSGDGCRGFAVFRSESDREL